MGELLYFAIYVCQQLGIMLGVGAQSVMLCAHLIAVHHREKEEVRESYARAAHFALGISLLFIVVSGAAAILVHLTGAQLDVVEQPAFLFKWLLILGLLPFYFLYNSLLERHAYYAFTGGTWYALFLVHTLGPVTSWATLITLYVLWLAFFWLVWMAFVGVMRWGSHAMPAQAPEQVVRYVAAPAPASRPEPVVIVVEKPTPPPPPPPPPAPKPVPPPPPPAPKPVPPPPPPAPVVPPPPPKPAPVVVAPPAPVVVVQERVAVTSAPAVVPPLPGEVQVTVAVAKESWWKRFVALFKTKKIELPPAPQVQLPPPPAPPPPPPPPPPAPKPVPPPPPPAPKPVPPPPPPAPVVPPPPPKPAPVVVAPPAPAAKPLSIPAVVATPAPQSQGFMHDVIDHILVPALRVMPQKPEDIGKQNRPPVVKLD